ncbi:MAG: helix-turn-helix domain-containing protein [Pleurocapsa minor GSE-CHR-MK-17-07R]|jgi:excisionase family DNA binding protein|nr:helix-turn-helix domain-containing protein [Pleurocapsa minor GSE-CHR-MK 17-07R]
MIEIVCILLGLYLLYRGQFKIAGRYIAKPQGRRIGLLLLMPSVATFCASFWVTLNSVTVSEDGTASINLDDALLGNLLTFQLIVLAVVLVIIASIIYNAPRTPPEEVPYVPPTPGGLPPASDPWHTPAPIQPRAPAQRPPDIMTVQEAAGYMRISEQEVLNLIEDGKLPAARMGGNNYRIARIAIDDFVSGK